jgi:hypothetical protein
MITLQRSGRYKLIETKANNKVLYLDSEVYAWVEPVNIGEILVYSHKVHKTDCILSMGEYRLYEVSDQPELSDQQHLELAVGEDRWQGYLLLSGLPDDHRKRARIIPTRETISDDPQYTTIIKVDT